MKKTLATLVLLSLICFLHHSSAAVVGPSALRGGCCPQVTRVPVPKGRVKHVGETPVSCPRKAIVVTTVCNETRCVDADWRWAKRLLTEFQTPDATLPPPVVKVFNCTKK